MSWKLIITRVDNGFILKTCNDMEPHTTIIEEKEQLDESHTKALLAERLCWEVLNEFGLAGNKHDRFRFHTEIKEQNPAAE